MALLDDLSPDFVGGDVIALSLREESLEPKAFGAVSLDVDYSGAVPGGISRPLELVIQAPTKAGYVRKIFRRVIPKIVTFFPVSGGEHLVLIREVGHNQFHGKIVVDVAGDDLIEA